MEDKADGGSLKIEINKRLNPEGSVMDVMDGFLKDYQDQSEKWLAQERKNPVWKRFPDCYDRVCRDHLMSDGWTLNDAAHLLSGYVPGRPFFKDNGTEAIEYILKHLKNSVGSSLYPSKKRVLGADLFPSKDLIKWALGKKISLHEVLVDRIRSSVVTAPVGQSQEENKVIRKKRKDVIQREQAQALAVDYWNKELEEKGVRRKRSEVIRYLIKELDFLDLGDDEKVKRWIQPVCPWREEFQEKYGN